MPGLSLFVKRGETIEIPQSAGIANGTIVRCRLYKIGVE
jgi:hypothetical protein